MLNTRLYYPSFIHMHIRYVSIVTRIGERGAIFAFKVILLIWIVYIQSPLLNSSFLVRVINIPNQYNQESNEDKIWVVWTCGYLVYTNINYRFLRIGYFKQPSRVNPIKHKITISTKTPDEEIFSENYFIDVETPTNCSIAEITRVHTTLILRIGTPKYTKKSLSLVTWLF